MEISTFLSFTQIFGRLDLKKFWKLQSFDQKAENINSFFKVCSHFEVRGAVGQIQQGD